MSFVLDAYRNWMYPFGDAEVIRFLQNLAHHLILANTDEEIEDELEMFQVDFDFLRSRSRRWLWSRGFPDVLPAKYPWCSCIELRNHKQELITTAHSCLKEL